MMHCARERLGGGPPREQAGIDGRGGVGEEEEDEGDVHNHRAGARTIAEGGGGEREKGTAEAECCRSEGEIWPKAPVRSRLACAARERRRRLEIWRDWLVRRRRKRKEVRNTRRVGICSRTHGKRFASPRAEPCCSACSPLENEAGRRTS